MYLAIPGLHELHRYDRRNQLFDSTPRPLNTVDRTLLETDYYVIWRIVDPRLFYESNGDEKAALARIDEITYGEVRETLNRHSLAELVSPRARVDVQKEITERVGREARAARHQDRRRAARGHAVPRGEPREGLRPHAHRARALRA